ncbi:MAG: hypothetical protein AAF975_03665 [Spirochaetota bacterium]
MLEREWAYYKEHETEFLGKYKGQWIVISGEQVSGSHESQEEAYESGVKDFGLGHFMIQQVEEPEKLIQRFYSRVRV